MSSIKRILKNSVMSCSLLIMTLAVLASPAYAWSSSTDSPTLQGTSDYIQTNDWLGSGDTFSFQSSSYLLGTNPENAYLIQDSENITLNGIGVSLSNTGSSTYATANSATYTCTSYGNWYCGDIGYNLQQSGLIWNTTSADTTKVVIYAGVQAFYNQASLTKWD
jgi:hypothetical protein